MPSAYTGSDLLKEGHMSTNLEKEQPMNESILNYPGFQALPKGVKQMLLASETHFFDQPAPHRQEQKRTSHALRPIRGFNLFRAIPICAGV
jgi:hypothetical protein